MRGDKPFLFTNCKTGEGIPALLRADPKRPALRSEAAVTGSPPDGRRQRCILARRPADGRVRLGALGRSGARRISGRAAADGERRGRQVWPPAPRLRATRRPARSSPTSTARAVLAQRALYPERALPDMAWVFIDHHLRLRAAGRPARPGGRARPGRARARDHPVRDQDPRHGRQLRGADPGHHAGRRRLPGIPARPADPASAARGSLSDTRISLARSATAALLRDHSAGTQAPSPGRMLRRHTAVACDHRARPDGARCSPRSC